MTKARRAMQERKAFEGQELTLHSGGHELHLSVDAAPIYDLDQSLIGAISIITTPAADPMPSVLLRINAYS